MIVDSNAMSQTDSRPVSVDRGSGIKFPSHPKKTWTSNQLGSQSGLRFLFPAARRQYELRITVRLFNTF